MFDRELFKKAYKEGYKTALRESTEVPNEQDTDIFQELREFVRQSSIKDIEVYCDFYEKNGRLKNTYKCDFNDGGVTLFNRKSGRYTGKQIRMKDVSNYALKNSIRVNLKDGTSLSIWIRGVIPASSLDFLS